jgi:hypothetical protein
MAQNDMTSFGSLNCSSTPLIRVEPFYFALTKELGFPFPETLIGGWCQVIARPPLRRLRLVLLPGATFDGQGHFRSHDPDQTFARVSAAEWLRCQQNFLVLFDFPYGHRYNRRAFGKVPGSPHAECPFSILSLLNE